MSNTVISVENLSKQYRLGNVGTGTLSHDLNRWWHTVRGKEDPFLKIGEENNRAKRGSSDYVWALKDINFEVKKGEVLGIIGKNGAGKSTLLKILSRTTTPTTGSFKVKGRIASLLEVGTGFHPELTGRENIFLNGAILGMTKTEIKNKFDEIVDFSGVERYIDTPVKRYSSGMYVRLAFAVAAHLESEILILDEVLAVGDAEFQKKCLGKMKDVSGKEGRTVLFVSHNMAAVKSLCTNGLLLRNGKILSENKIDDLIALYLKNGQQIMDSAGIKTWEKGKEPGGEEVKLLSIKIVNADNEIANTFLTSSNIKIEITYKILKEISGARVILQLLDDNNIIIFSTTNHSITQNIKKEGLYVVNCTIPANLLNNGRYYIAVRMGIPRVKVLQEEDTFLYFDSILDQGNESTFPEKWAGIIAPKINWDN